MLALLRSASQMVEPIGFPFDVANNPDLATGCCKRRPDREPRILFEPRCFVDHTGVDILAIERVRVVARPERIIAPLSKTIVHGDVSQACEISRESDLCIRSNAIFACKLTGATHQ